MWQEQCQSQGLLLALELILRDLDLPLVFGAQSIKLLVLGHGQQQLGICDLGSPPSKVSKKTLRLGQ